MIMKKRYKRFRDSINNKLVGAILDGVIKGIKTGIMLLKVMIPVYIIVILIKYSPIMPWLQQACAPVMKLFNLPSDAVVPIITGMLTDEYGMVAALSGFNFTMAAITTIAMIGLTAHSLPVEAAIAQKMGFSALKITIYRIAMAVLIGLMIGWIGGVVL